MTDILKRLREDPDLSTALEAEAADEIERLRETLQRIDTFVSAIGPKRTKELASISNNIRAALGENER